MDILDRCICLSIVYRAHTVIIYRKVLVAESCGRYESKPKEARTELSLEHVNLTVKRESFYTSYTLYTTFYCTCSPASGLARGEIHEIVTMSLGRFVIAFWAS